MDFSCVVSNTTRKYETRDIASQATRKINTFLVETTNDMDNTKRISKAQARAILRLEEKNQEKGKDV